MVFYLTVRVLHILAAATWLGVSIFAAFYLIPAIGDSGPEGGKVMQAIEKRGYAALFPILAATTIFTGLWLYYRYTGGFDPTISRSHAGMAFGFGGLLGILSAIVGGALLSPAAIKMRAAMQEAATASNASARSAALATAAQLRNRIVSVARLAVLMLIGAIVLMSIAVLI